MDEVSYEYRQAIEDKDGQKYKVTTVVRVQKKTVLTNPDIDRRQGLKKFGDAAGLEKGKQDSTITLDDKDIYLLPFGQERSEDAIAKFVSSRTHREKMDRLKQKENLLISGKGEESNVRKQYVPDQTIFQIKVTNIPTWLDQQQLESVFNIVVRPKKIFRPCSKDDGKPRDFALITYSSLKDAQLAIKTFNGKRCENQILGAEVAENKNAQQRPRPRK